MRIFNHLLFLENLTKKNGEMISLTQIKNSNTSSKFAIVLEFLKIEV